MAGENWTRGNRSADRAERAHDIGTPPPPTEPHTGVRSDDLRALLDTENDDARLVLQEGRVQLRTDAADTTGAVTIISRAGLRERLAGATPDARRLLEQAVELDTEIASLGA